MAVLCEFPEFAWNVYEFAFCPKGWWHSFLRNLQNGDPVAAVVARNYLSSITAIKTSAVADDNLYSVIISTSHRASLNKNTETDSKSS